MTRLSKSKAQSPLSKGSMHSIWNTSFGEVTLEARESCRIHDPDHLISQQFPASSLPAVSGGVGVNTNMPQHVSNGTSSRPSRGVSATHNQHPDSIAGTPYGYYSQLDSIRTVPPISPEARNSSRIPFFKRSSSQMPAEDLSSIQRDAPIPNNEPENHVQATPNPFNDPMSDVSLVTTVEAPPPPPAAGLARVLSRYRVSAMVDKTMQLRKVFIVALVMMQLAVLSTAAVVAIIFQQIRDGVKAGVAAWLVVSLMLLTAAALTAVIVYWKREKLIKEGGQEFELESQERGQSVRAKDEWIKDLEGRNDLLTQQVQSLRMKVKNTETRLQAALGQEDLDSVISPCRTRPQSWFLQSGRTAISGQAPVSLASLPPLNFDVIRSDTAKTRASEDEAGGDNLAGAEVATNATDGWETIIGSDDADRQARARRLRPGVLRSDELRTLSAEERLAYFAKRRREVEARDCGSRFI